MVIDTSLWNKYMIVAYSDGACKGNGKQGGGAGGYGVHISYPNGDILDIWGGENATTNNRMELTAAIIAIERTPTDTRLQLWTDSSYVKDGITQWMAKWKKHGWKKSDGQTILNLDLWQRLDHICQNRDIDWQWIKGHAGHTGNEMADKLANLGVTEHGEKHTIANNQNLQITSSDTRMTNTTPFLSDEEYYGQMVNIEPIDTEHMDDHPKTVISKVAGDNSIKPTVFTRHNEQNPQYDGNTSQANPHFWAVIPDPINRGRADRQLIMDTETTGFEDQNGDRIVEVGILEMIDRKLTGQQVHVYLNPDKLMDDEVIKVHGISNEFVADKPRFADVAPYLYEFMKGSELIAHNANFDMRFLQMEFTKAGFSDFSEQVKVTDSLAIARELYPGQRNSLDMLVRRLGVGQRDRTYHGALLDSEILAEVYLAMTGGQISLAIDEEKQRITQDGQVNFSNLSELAHMLITSKSDSDADRAWRISTFK